MFHFVYKTTNLKNGKFYIGVHSTSNINDGYLGSGDNLKRAIKKYGSENFNREILQFFDCIEDACTHEANIVTEEFVKDKRNYNIVPGGGMPPTRSGQDHHYFGKKNPEHSERMKQNNPTKLSHVREKSASTRIIINEVTGEGKRIPKNDLTPKGWKNINSGKVTVKDSSGNTMSVSKDDPRYLSGELKHLSTGKVTVKDSSGNTMSVSKDDPRYLSGELLYFRKGYRKETEEQKLERKKNTKLKFIEKRRIIMIERNLQDSEIILQCPHCKKTGKSQGMKSWHFDNCRNKL